MVENDPIWKEMDETYPEEKLFPYIFSEDDMMHLLMADID